MTIFDKLKKTIELLKSEKCVFALAGGILVSAFRDDVRATNDIDLLIFSGNESFIKAEKIIRTLGLTPHPVKLHELKHLPMMNKKNAPPFILVGRGTELEVGVNFILPDMPWFNSALDRAQSHLIDFGFGEIPCITLEDMVIAKIFAGREKDRDDLRSIFRRGHIFDVEYLAGEILRLELFVSKELRMLMPKNLQPLIRKKSR